MIREGEPVPEGTPLLVISGTVTKFTQGSVAKRALIGFGFGRAEVKADVKVRGLVDAPRPA